jgi:hypothetical protein
VSHSIEPGGGSYMTGLCTDIPALFLRIRETF